MPFLSDPNSAMGRLVLGCFLLITSSVTSVDAKKLIHPYGEGE